MLGFLMPPTLMPPCRSLLARQLKQPEASPLLLPAYWSNTPCISATVNPATIAGSGPGRETDFYLYVTADRCASGVVAYAAVCAIGGASYRPIMGAVNLCPGAFEALPASRQLDTLVHELMHTLVFLPELLPLFPAGDPRTSLPGPYGPATVITSPRVVQEVRRLFECPTAAGAPLESGGGDGSSDVHWEARLFQVGEGEVAGNTAHGIVRGWCHAPGLGWR